MIYEATRESVQRHPVPTWFDDAKLGVFIHWGVYSVPGYAPRGAPSAVYSRAGQAASPYAEWYWNSLKLPDSAVRAHHRKTHGDASYESFAADFRKALEGWDPRAWAKSFRDAGARYVVLVTKHHDGFCLWPSAVRHPDPSRRDWNAGRDLVGELAACVRAEGLRFGVYYSGGLDWTFNDRPLRGVADLMAGMPDGEYAGYATAQVRELIERYAPEVLWNDISWPTGRQELFRLVADYYNAVPEGVINDRWMHRTLAVPLLRIGPILWLANLLVRRWMVQEEGLGSPPAPSVYDYRTPEYSSYAETQSGKWECARGIDKSFAFNRNSRPEDFLSHEELLHDFVDAVSKNGNLLINVGPRGEDARIPELQLERLRWLGDFLRDCGEAIHGSRPWKRAEGETREGVPVRFTTRAGILYATLLGTPTGRTVTFVDVPTADPAAVALLGDPRPPRAARVGDGDMRVEIGSNWPDRPAHGLRLGPAWI